MKYSSKEDISSTEDFIIKKVKAKHSNGVDIVIDATGIESCIQASLKLAKKGGKVVLAGYGRGKIMNIRIDDIHINNLKVIGAGNNWNMHRKAIDLMKQALSNYVNDRKEEIFDLLYNSYYHLPYFIFIISQYEKNTKKLL